MQSRTSSVAIKAPKRYRPLVTDSSRKLKTHVPSIDRLRERVLRRLLIISSLMHRLIFSGPDRVFFSSNCFFFCLQLLTACFGEVLLFLVYYRLLSPFSGRASSLLVVGRVSLVATRLLPGPPSTDFCSRSSSNSLTFHPWVCYQAVGLQFVDYPSQSPSLLVSHGLGHHPVRHLVCHHLRLQMGTEALHGEKHRPHPRPAVSRNRPILRSCISWGWLLRCQRIICVSEISGYDDSGAPLC